MLFCQLHVIDIIGQTYSFCAKVFEISRRYYVKIHRICVAASANAYIYHVLWTGHTYVCLSRKNLGRWFSLILNF